MSAALRRVHIYTPRLGVGGGELSLLRLGEGLARLGLEVVFVLHELTPMAEEPRPGIGIACLRTAGTLASMRALAAHLRQHRPQVLLSAFPHSNVAAVVARAMAGKAVRQATRLVLSEHAPLSHQVRHMGGWRYRAMPWLMPLAYTRADAVVAVSQGVAADLSHMSGARVQPQVIYNPVLPADLAQRQAAAAPHPWLAGAQFEVVMSVSRLAPEKDIPTLMRAFAQVAAQRPKARLLLLGEGPQRASLQALVAELGLQGRCELVGAVSNPFAWLARANVFALASRFEGFGNVLVEAMACGAAVVSTDCPVGPAEILQSGKLGALVAVGDVPAMAQAMAQALQQGPVPQARGHSEQFTEARCAQAYAALFSTLL